MHINPISVSNYNSSIKFTSEKAERPENPVSTKGPNITMSALLLAGLLNAAFLSGCGSNPVGPSTTAPYHGEPNSDPNHPVALIPANLGHLAIEELNGGICVDPNRPEEKTPRHPGKIALEETNGGLWSDPNRPVDPIPRDNGHKVVNEETNGGLYSDPNHPEEPQSQYVPLQR